MVDPINLLRLLRLIRKMYSIFQTKSVFKQIIWTEQSTVLLVEFTFVFDDLLLLVFFLFYSTLSLFVYLIKFPMNNSGSYGLEHLVEWYVEMVHHSTMISKIVERTQSKLKLSEVCLALECLPSLQSPELSNVMIWFPEILRLCAVIALWYLK